MTKCWYCSQELIKNKCVNKDCVEWKFKELINKSKKEK